MSDLEKQAKLDEMRRKLYERGGDDSASVIERHSLTDEPVAVSRNWPTTNAQSTPATSTDLRQGLKVPTTPPPATTMTEPVVPKRRRYRVFILLGSLLLFMLVAGLSSVYLYMGGNQISGNNIAISMNGPRTVGGGEVLPIQITVTNNNTVEIESATLIVKYPAGTMSTDQPPRQLYEERIPLNNLVAGEVRNLSVRAVLFGDENTKQDIQATLEYRIIGSNGTFYKDADALSVLIGSTPLVLRIENIEKVASGQETDVVIKAVSNASTPLYNVLISAEYPNGFTYQSSTPEPVYNNNVWQIAELKPEETKEIRLKGVVHGLNDEKLHINFQAGPADQDNQYRIGSLLMQSGIDFIIERPFIDLGLTINGQTGSDIVLNQGLNPSVGVKVTNTLDETVYDLVVEAVPDGNALTASSIGEGSSGFYDSNRGVVRWEVSSNEDFAEVFPGSTRSLNFGVKPNSNQRGAAFGLTVNVYARRVAERSAAEELLGSTRLDAKFSSLIMVGGQAGHDSGPVPPQVGKITTYTITLVAEAGVNDVSDAVVETSLPIYIDWLDTYQGDGAIVYNTVNKQISWNIGDIAAGKRKQVSFQLRFQPSLSQVRRTPTLLNKQDFRATDRFTNTLLQDNAPAITTELSTELGFFRGNGMVVE